MNELFTHAPVGFLHCLICVFSMSLWIFHSYAIKCQRLCSGVHLEGKREKKIGSIECTLLFKYKSGTKYCQCKSLQYKESIGTVIPFRCLHNHFRSGAGPTLQYPNDYPNKLGMVHLKVVTTCQYGLITQQHTKFMKRYILFYNPGSFSRVLGS